MSPHQREDDRIIKQLIHELREDRVQWNEWRKSHDDSATIFRKDIDERLKPLEAWLLTANSSWKLVIGTITITGILFKAWDFVRAHFK